MAILLLALIVAVAALLAQVSKLREETRAAGKQVAGEISRISSEGRQTVASLARVSEALEAAPAAARAISAPEALPRIVQGLREIATEFRTAREEMRTTAQEVTSALEWASAGYVEAAKEFEARGERLATSLGNATREMAKATTALRDTTARSAELHETLRANAVSFQMVQDLIESMDHLLPQVTASSQSLARLIERVEEKNLFSEQVFTRFEGALGELSGAVTDLAALSRTFAAQLDQQPTTVAVG